MPVDGFQFEPELHKLFVPPPVQVTFAAWALWPIAIAATTKQATNRNPDLRDPAICAPTPSKVSNVMEIPCSAMQRIEPPKCWLAYIIRVSRHEVVSNEFTKGSTSSTSRIHRRPRPLLAPTRRKAGIFQSTPPCRYGPPNRPSDAGINDHTSDTMPRNSAIGRTHSKRSNLVNGSRNLPKDANAVTSVGVFILVFVEGHRVHVRVRWLVAAFSRVPILSCATPVLIPQTTDFKRWITSSSRHRAATLHIHLSQPYTEDHSVVPASSRHSSPEKPERSH